MKPALPLIDQCREYNRQIEESYIALALSLVEISEQQLYKEVGYESFAEFYQNDLGRQKSTISKLLKVGNWIKTNGLVSATQDASYERLYLAINAFPEKSADYVVSAAKTNTAAELKDENSERLHGVHEHIAGEERWGQCQTCDRFIRV